MGSTAVHYVKNVVNDSTGWGEKTAAEAGVGIHFFQDYMFTAYSDGTRWIPFNNGSAILDMDSAFQSLKLEPGVNTSLAITPGTYQINSDTDVFIKASDASNLYGARMLSYAGGFKITTGSLASQTGLDFGTGNFSFEAFFTLKSVSNNAKLFYFGHSTGANILIQVATPANSTTYLTLSSIIVGNAAAVIKSGSGWVTTNILPSDAIQHLVGVVTRGGNGGTGNITYFLNGAQVGQTNWTEQATQSSFDLNSSTNAGSLLAIGATSGTAFAWDGDIYMLNFYKAALTLAEVQVRHQLGPLRNVAIPVDTKSLNLSWAISFNNYAAWANPLYPECTSGYGNAIFNTPVGNAVIATKTAGTPATINDITIYARQPQRIQISKAYLSILNKSLTDGYIKVIPGVL